MTPMLALAIYVLGAAALSLYAGLDGARGEGVVSLVIFWPLALAMVLVSAPFYGLWKLGALLRERTRVKP